MYCFLQQLNNLKGGGERLIGFFERSKDITITQWTREASLRRPMRHLSKNYMAQKRAFKMPEKAEIVQKAIKN